MGVLGGSWWVLGGFRGVFLGFIIVLEVILKVVQECREGDIETNEIHGYTDMIRASYLNLKKDLAKQEIVEMDDSVGKMVDLDLHYVKRRIYNPDLKQGIVTHVIKKGYYYKGEVLRHAEVEIAKREKN